MFAICAVVFVGMLGVTLVMPLFPFFAMRADVGPDMITVLMGVYAAGQFFAAPFWGRLSDRVGRKPIFLTSLVGAVVSYGMLVFAESFAMLLAARIVGGLMAGNVAVAFAAVSDLTSDENRAKNMGLIGGAFNLGFVAGPAVGGLLAGDGSTDRLTDVAFAAGGMSIVALIVTMLLLTETLPPHRRTRVGAASTVDAPVAAAGLREIWRNRPLFFLVLLSFVYVAAGSMFDTTFSLYANLALGYGPAEIGYMFSFMGLVGTAVQIGLVGRIAKAIGDVRMIELGIAAYSFGLAIMIVTEELGLVMLAAALLSAANGLFMPGTTSLVSKAARVDQRGWAMGVYQSASNLGRVVTPLVSGLLFANLGSHAPFVAGLVLLMPAFVLITMAGSRVPRG
jgi:DHA1 family tetracycline resistance protein-like MFS transporter